MKTATITYHKVPNYGALLQAYALQQVQKKMSVDNIIIDYSPIEMKRCKRIKASNYKLLLVKIIIFFLTILHRRQIKKQFQVFRSFSKQMLHLSREYKDLKDLKADPPKADLYLAGSDQLWKVSQAMFPAFFLDFGDNNMKRVSYAVSMGNCEVAENLRQEVQRLLSRFASLSVREPCAKAYIENILNKKVDVQLHFDPVFLLIDNEWQEFSNTKEIMEPYILCFPMGGHPLINQSLQKLKSLTGYKTVVIATDLLTGVKGDLTIWDATPQEFVYLIQNAQYVLTTSFHGTAFSTIFKKRFFSFTNPKGSCRIVWLLQRLGLKHRIVSTVDEINLEEIDYSYSKAIIEEERALSMEYLHSIFNINMENTV